MAELAAHEQQLLARLRPLISEEQAQVGELLPFVARHLADERALAVYDLVVRERQHVVFGEHVEAAEGELVVVEAAVNGVFGQVLEGVVHPSHVPLQAEAEPAHVGGPRNHGPGGGLLGDHLHVGMAAVNIRIHLLQEADGLQVLIAAVAVGNPFAGLARVVEVEHGGDRVHAQAVSVILVEPEQRAGEQEAAHLVAAEVKDVRFPLRMEALARVRVLVEVRTVEVSEPVRVVGEMRRHPVEDHAYAVLVQMVHQVHEILRCAVAAGGREEADHLVSPGAVEGMLHYRQEFHVCEPHVVAVLGQLGRQFAIGQPAIALFPGAHP